MSGFTEEEFTGFKRKHYRVANGPCWDACNAYRTAKQAVSDAHFDFAKSIGGVGLYSGNTENVGNALPVNAIIFDGALPEGWKRRNWSSMKGIKSGQIAAFPDKRSKAGKAALVQIMALPLLPTPDRICKAIGYPLSISYERGGDNPGSGSQGLGFFEVAGLGWIKDTFYLSLPDYAGQRGKLETQGWTITSPAWAPLEGMELVLKEQVDLDFALDRQAAAAARNTGAQS